MNAIDVKGPFVTKSVGASGWYLVSSESKCCVLTVLQLWFRGYSRLLPIFGFFVVRLPDSLARWNEDVQACPFESSSVAVVFCRSNMGSPRRLRTQACQQKFEL